MGPNRCRRAVPAHSDSPPFPIHRHSAPPSFQSTVIPELDSGIHGAARGPSVPPSFRSLIPESMAPSAALPARRHSGTRFRNPWRRPRPFPPAVIPELDSGIHGAVRRPSDPPSFRNSIPKSMAPSRAVDSGIKFRNDVRDGRPRPLGTIERAAPPNARGDSASSAAPLRHPAGHRPLRRMVGKRPEDPRKGWQRG